MLLLKALTTIPGDGKPLWKWWHACGDVSWVYLTFISFYRLDKGASQPEGLLSLFTFDNFIAHQIHSSQVVRGGGLWAANFR